ncbi:MAG: hypothetical protein IPJ65_20165 [Archangiaceae bacterium]|nr:hypothetical protein [Archangiaceae bacterium]
MSLGVALAVALAAGAEPPAATRVAVDLTQLGERDFQVLDGLGLENRATVRLIQEGFAVVSLRSAPQLVLRVTARAEALLLVAESPVSRAQRVVRRGGLTAAELHLAVAQKLVELAREVPTEPPPQPQPPPPSPAAPPAPAPEPGPVQQEVVSPPPAEPSQAPGFSVGAGGAALLREGGVDPLALLWIERHGWRVRPKVVLGFTASQPARLQVFEVQGQLGIAWPWSLRPGLELSVSALVGAVLHSYSTRPPLQPESGTRVDLLVSLPLELTFRPTPRFFMSVRLCPALSSRGREHLEGSNLLWRRGAARAEVGANIGVSFD